MKKENFVLLDLRGLLMHMMYSGTDIDAILGNDNKLINRAEHGVTGFLTRYLIPILETTPPVNIIAVTDGGSLYRRGLFPAYKMNRKKQQDKDPNAELTRQQINRMQEIAVRLLRYLGCHTVGVPGVEADDVIALLAESLKDFPKIIHTVDADIVQLTDPTTMVFLKGEPVIETYKETPVRWIALQKSLVGDASDNYGGVKGFGAVAWADLMNLLDEDEMTDLEQCVATGQFEELAETLPLVEGKLRKILARLYEDRENWTLMYRLATLHPEICYGFNGMKKVQPEYEKRVPSRAKFTEILASVGSLDLLESFEPWLPTEKLVTAANVQDIFNTIDEQMDHTQFVAFDYEAYDKLNHAPFREASTKGSYLDVLSQVPTGASFSFGANGQHIYYFSCGHRDTDNVDMSVIRDVLEECQTQCRPLIAHNASYEEQVTKQSFGLQLVAPYDTLIMSSYADENREAGLKSLSRELLRYSQDTFEETLEAAGAADMSELTGDQVLHYGCDDALVTFHLFHVLRLTMLVEKTWRFYSDYNRLPVHLLNRAKETGVVVDWARMEALRAEDRVSIEENMASVREALAEHASETSEPAAAALFKSDSHAIKAQIKNRLVAKGTYTLSKLTAEIEAVRLRFLAGTQYSPLVEDRETRPFTGTPGQFRAAATGVGFRESDVKLSGLTGAAITAFKVAVAEGDLLAGVPDRALAERFLELLPDACTKAFKASKKAGSEGELSQEWTRLAAFVQPFIDASSKVVVSGDALNLGSPKQMQELLYLKLRLPVRETTKPQRGSFRDMNNFPGAPATNEDAINAAIAEDCEFGDWRRELLERLVTVKSAETRESLYFSKYPLWNHPATGRIHPNIRDCGTATRRPTGGAPNLLQISKGKMRTLFTPTVVVPGSKEEYCIVAVDFSGQELRLTGSEARDPVMIDAYTAGGSYVDEYGMTRQILKDLHSVTACSFTLDMMTRQLGGDPRNYVEMDGDFISYTDFKTLLDAGEDALKALTEARQFDMAMVQKVVKAARRSAKAVNFLIVYGGSAKTLAAKLGIPEKTAEQIMSLVFNLYARLAPWQKENAELARAYGYVTTAYGNRKHVPEDIRSSDKSLRSRAERQACNFTIQSTAADILHIVESEIVKTRLMEETGAGLLAPVYDEIVSYVPVTRAYEFCQRIQDIMNVTPPSHAIPMMAECSVGWSWGDVVELGDRPAEEKIMAALESTIARKSTTV